MNVINSIEEIQEEIKGSSIIKGDCLEVMKHIKDKSIDLILCDLPYGTTHNKWDSLIPLDKLWNEYNRIIKDNAPVLLFGQPPFDKVLGVSNLEMLRYEWIWEKTTPTGFLNAKKMPMKCHENILVFYKKLPLYNPQKTYGHPKKESSAKSKRNCIKSDNYGNYKLTSYCSTERYPRDIIKFKTDKQKSALHPTQKPVALLEYLIKTYTDEGMTVLDNAMGSGSTCVAALNTNREFIGIENDEKYFEISKDRINNKIMDL